MIEIADWVVIDVLIAVLAALIIYAVYFKISTTRFPKTIEFNRQVEPNQNVTILTVEGIGVIRKISAQTTERNSALIDLTLDQSSYFVLDVPKEANNGKSSSNGQAKLKFDVKLDACFYKGFSLAIYNRGNDALDAKGKIDYEIKKSTTVTIKGLYKEFKGEKALMNQP
jgi:hypothetical protein